jgi:hypothetical protein
MRGPRGPWFAMLLLAAALPLAGCGGGGSPTGIDACTLLSGTIEADRTLADPCYHVVAQVYIPDAVTVTVSPGVTFYFDQDTGLETRDHGALNAAGTAADPITFTGVEQRRGYWDGLYFNNADSFHNVLQHVVVEYGGAYDHSGEHAGVFLDSSGYDVRVALTDSTIRNNEGWGLFLTPEAILADCTGNELTANASGPVKAYPPAVQYLSSASSYTGNDTDVVFVQGDYAGIDGDETWQHLDADYLIDGEIFVNDPGHWTIAAGATLVFRQDGGINVINDAALTAVGTASAPVTFTGAEEIAGYWHGIYFENANALENRLDYAVVAYGGGEAFVGGDRANIALVSSGYPLHLTCEHSTIRDSAGCGIWAAVEAVLNADVETSNAFTNNASGDVCRGS